jgi:hypothetical protein
MFYRFCVLFITLTTISSVVVSDVCLATGVRIVSRYTGIKKGRLITVITGARLHTLGQCPTCNLSGIRIMQGFPLNFTTTGRI